MSNKIIENTSLSLSSYSLFLFIHNYKYNQPPHHESLILKSTERWHFSSQVQGERWGGTIKGEGVTGHGPTTHDPYPSRRQRGGRKRVREKYHQTQDPQQPTASKTHGPTTLRPPATHNPKSGTTKSIYVQPLTHPRSIWSPPTQCRIERERERERSNCPTHRERKRGERVRERDE